MPTSCAVVKCGNRYGGDQKSFYRLPTVPKSGSDRKIQLKTIRRAKWLIALRRADLDDIKLNYIRICGDHFLEGKPANLYDIDHPDWIPSIKMGYNNDISLKKKARYNRLKQRRMMSEGRPAGDYDTENPDWVPSINMGYPNKPQKPIHKSSHKQQTDYISPHIEYLRSNVISQNESNEVATMELSSSNTDTEENSESNDMSDEGAVEQEINSQKQNICDEELGLPEELITCSKIFTSVYEEEGIISSENSTDEHVFSEFTDDNNELHQNMSSKKVQTYLTMVDLNKISDGYKASIEEVNKLKAKLKSLTEDILQLNEIYC